MPPALLFSVGIHLGAVLGFLISPRSDSASKVGNRALMILLSKSTAAKREVVTDATDNQQGLLSEPHFAPRPTAASAANSAANSNNAVAVKTTRLAITSSQTPLRSPPVAARAAAHGDSLRHWQTRLERFLSAHCLGLAERYGGGDVLPSMTVSADVSSLSRSDIKALDQFAVDTVQQLSPFTTFSKALAADSTL